MCAALHHRIAWASRWNSGAPGGGEFESQTPSTPPPGTQSRSLTTAATDPPPLPTRTKAGRKPRAGRAASRPLHASGSGSEVPHRDLAEHVDVQPLLSDDLSQPGVAHLKFSQLLRVVGARPAVTGYPTVPPRLGDHELPADLGERHTAGHQLVPLGQPSDDLLGRASSTLLGHGHGVPTEYSQRRTVEWDARRVVEWCRGDGVDLALLVPL